MTETCIALLDRLRDDGVIRPDHHAAALVRLDTVNGEPFTTLGEALLWLVDEGIVSDEELDAIGELSVTEAAFASNATRCQALAEMDALMQRKLDEYVKRAGYEGLKAAFPGPGWVWLGGAAAAVIAAAWYLFAPATPPQCGDDDVRKTLRTSMFSNRVQQIAKNPWAGGPAPSDLLQATYSAVKEVGYLPADRSRACSATLTVAGKSSAIAYILKPNDDGEMMIIGADPRVVRVRYGQTDKNGKMLDVGQPVGATQLAAAFERGAAAFETPTRSAERLAAMNRQRQRMGQPAETDTRSVRSIYPVGDCKALGGEKWSCRVQAEFRDRLMSAIGRSDWQVMEGDFSFVQKGTTWEVGEDFSRQYMDARVRARVADLKGDEAAARLEAIQQQRPDASAGKGAPRQNEARPVQNY